MAHCRSRWFFQQQSGDAYETFLFNQFATFTVMIFTPTTHINEVLVSNSGHDWPDGHRSDI